MNALPDLFEIVTQTLTPLNRGARTAGRRVSHHGHEIGEASPPPEPINSETYRDLRSALASMRSDDRDSWVAMGHHLKSLGEVGRGLWFEWSQGSDKFEPVDAARVWDSFTPSNAGPRAVFAAAQAGGWVNPRTQ